MDPFHRHLVERITNLEIELNALREVTWPVCQSLWDKDGPFQNRKQKKNKEIEKREKNVCSNRL
jgi:hypothetical protein